MYSRSGPGGLGIAPVVVAAVVKLGITALTSLLSSPPPRTPVEAAQFALAFLIRGIQERRTDWSYLGVLEQWAAGGPLAVPKPSAFSLKNVVWNTVQNRLRDLPESRSWAQSVLDQLIGAGDVQQTTNAAGVIVLVPASGTTLIPTAVIEQAMRPPVQANVFGGIPSWMLLALGGGLLFAVTRKGA